MKKSGFGKDLVKTGQENGLIPTSRERHMPTLDKLKMGLGRVAVIALLGITGMQVYQGIQAGNREDNREDRTEQPAPEGQVDPTGHPNLPTVPARESDLPTLETQPSEGELPSVEAPDSDTPQIS